MEWNDISGFIGLGIALPVSEFACHDLRRPAPSNWSVRP
jgi:hypothetical protein